MNTVVSSVESLVMNLAKNYHMWCLAQVSIHPSTAVDFTLAAYLPPSTSRSASGYPVDYYSTCSTHLYSILMLLSLMSMMLQPSLADALPLELAPYSSRERRDVMEPVGNSQEAEIWDHTSIATHDPRAHRSIVCQTDSSHLYRSSST
jgi:hypothetical protein